MYCYWTAKNLFEHRIEILHELGKRCQIQYFFFESKETNSTWFVLTNSRVLKFFNSLLFSISLCIQILAFILKWIILNVAQFESIEIWKISDCSLSILILKFSKSGSTHLKFRRFEEWTKLVFEFMNSVLCIRRQLPRCVGKDSTRIIYIYSTVHICIMIHHRYDSSHCSTFRRNWHLPLLVRTSVAFDENSSVGWEMWKGARHWVMSFTELLLW